MRALPPNSETDSYFLTQLAKNARSQGNADPTDLDSLVGCLDYLPPRERQKVSRAYKYAAYSHAGQTRRTGHAYITHPTAVAKTLAGMRMDSETISAALLHDVIEDSEANKVVLSKKFGNSVAGLVDGVSKLTKISKSRDEAQAENFQKMALAMAKDIRVILVKMADRLHNMRTIGVMSSDQRRRIARETLEFYAPIADRLGMYSMRIELEELGFRALYPFRADRIERAVKSARGNRKELVHEIRDSISAALNREGISAEVVSREKNIYSIYKKMRSQQKSFNEIMDVFGFRLIVDHADNCYRALGVVHNLYKPVVTRFKDYVAIPKVNGYQSLHTSLFGMHGVPIEVQIRTKQMHAVAENGIAGHWLYKNDGEFEQNQQRARQWAQSLLDLQKKAGNPLEFIDSLKVDLFPDEVYVFTPEGKILELPTGASAVDFAYNVHTDIGNSCVSCKIDGALAPLSQQLESGQVVEIVRGPTSKPNPDWLTFVVTSRARSAIRHELKNQHNEEAISLGRILLNRALGNANTSISNLDFRRLRKVFKEMGVRRLDELLEAIGNGNLLAYVAAQKLLAADNPNYEAVEVEGGGPVAIQGGEGLVINYGKCCGPVPGDHIVGHMTTGKGFVVHIETCPNLGEIRRRAAHELIPARWTITTAGEFRTNLKVNVLRRKGILAEIASEITGTETGIDNIGVEERNSEVSTLVMSLFVRDRSHLARLMRHLRRSPFVLNLARSGN